MAVPLKGQLDSILQKHSKVGMVLLSPDYTASMQRYKELVSCSRVGEILTSRLETAALPNSNAERNHKPHLCPLMGGGGHGGVTGHNTAGSSEASTPQLESRYHTPFIRGIIFGTSYTCKGNLVLVHSRFSYLRAKS